MESVPSADARFRKIYDANYAAIRDYCLRRLSTEDAADAAAEIFMITWRKLALVPTGEEARLWLFGVARNVVAHRHRSGYRQSKLQNRLGQLLTPARAGLEEVVVRQSQEQEVVSAMQRLKAEDRELLRLKMWEELSHDGIASMLGVSTHAVDMRVQRAVKRLGKLLKSKINVGPHPIAKGGEL